MTIMKWAGLALATTTLTATSAMADIIKPTGATASSTFSSSYLPSFTIDGSGLTGGGVDPAEAHATYVQGNHWTTAAGTNPVGQWIDWTFSAPQTLGAAYIWNHRSNGVAANGQYEPTLFGLNFYNQAGTLLLSLDDVALAPDTATAQRIDFGLVNDVARVRFDVRQTQGSTTYTGLGEVAFDTTSYVAAVPEPSTWTMMVAGFGVIGGSMRARHGRRRLKIA